MLRVFRPTANPAPRYGRRDRRTWAPEILEDRALLSGSPTTYTVTDLSDSLTDTSSLRYAITQANANPNAAGSRIEFDPTVFSSPQTISLSGTLELSESPGPEMIDGPGDSVLTVARSSATGTPDFRIFAVASGTVATIAGLTASGGQVVSPDAGGGIENSGTLTLVDSNVTGNAAGVTESSFISLGSGGGIANSGTLTLTDSTVNNNSATRFGGAIDNEATGTLTITRSTLSGNVVEYIYQGGQGVLGGGIYNEGAVTLGSSTLMGNAAGSDSASGGGIYNVGTMSVAGSSLTGNNSVIGKNSGGGIDNEGTLALTNSNLDGNWAAVGGCIHNGNTGTLMLTDCTLNGNVVYGDQNSNYAGSGGGINNDGMLTIVDSTLSNNSVTPPGLAAAPAGGNGGGIYNTGTLTVLSSTLAGNSASNMGDANRLGILGAGGGIDNLGTLTLTDCTVNGDAAALGGAIYNGGTLRVTASNFSNNAANDRFVANAVGGGIDNTTTGTATVIGSTFSGNTVYALDGNPYTDQYVLVGNGGAISNAGNLAVTDCKLSNNTAMPGGLVIGSGGGIYNTGTLALAGSALSGNSAGIGFNRSSPSFEGNGGGIDNEGTLTVTNCTFSANSVSSSFATHGGGGKGGGIYNNGTLTLTNSTLADNLGQANGGGIDNDTMGTLTVTACTLSGNSANAIGSPDFGNGGGIENGGTLTLTNSTLADNWAGTNGGAIDNDATGTLTVTACTLNDNDAHVIGSPSVGDGGGIENEGTLTLTMTIFANSSYGGNVVSTAASVFVSRGHNLFSDAPAAALDPTDLVNTDPLLGPLADNGGPTFTQALLPGSPAIDAGVAVSGVTTDQRGILRPWGTAPDIGAFESRGFTIAIVSGDQQSVPGGSSFPNPLVVAVTSPYGEPVAGGDVQFIAPTTGPTATFSGAIATIDASGHAQITPTAGTVAGSYFITAQVPGALGVAFSAANFFLPETVVSLRRFGYHAQPTQLVVTFAATLDSVQAQNVENYTLLALAPARRHRVRSQVIIPMRSAQYNATAHTVTLTPAPRLRLRSTYKLVTTDLTSSNPPRQTVTIFNRRALAGRVVKEKSGTLSTVLLWPGGPPRSWWARWHRG